MKAKERIGQRLLSLLLMVTLCLGVLPITGFAADSTESVSYSYLALGDSITTGYGLDDAEREGFVALLANAISADSTYNAGVNGLTSSALLEALTDTAGENYAVYMAAVSTADVITITIGGNDLLAVFYNYVAALYSTFTGTAVTADDVPSLIASLSGNPMTASTVLSLLNNADYSALTATLTAAVTETVTNINTIVSTIKAANADAIVLVANQYNPYKWLTGCDNIVALFETAVTGYNTALAQYNVAGYTVVDVYSAFDESVETLTNAELDLTTYSIDFDIHPNAAGHTAIAAAMAAAYAAEFTPAVKSEFDDVDEESWYYGAVIYAAKSGYMVGTTETTFEPESTATRAQFVTVLYRMAGNPTPTEVPTFTDLNTTYGTWYIPAVAWAKQYGIVNGTTETTFSPDEPITREQIATIIWRYIGANASSYDLSSFTDSGEISEYAKTAVAWAVENGLIIGNGDGTLNPKGEATRAEIATLIMRVVAALSA
ncbi:MAG: S-layer homology domain-containing protein [Firmicutes bacterium]|nr:S-layer homology domain-containing protein [Bacillota bacterium]